MRQFNARAHVVIVTVRVLDFALGNLIKHLREIRKSQPRRPIVLVLTCLHEAYPQQQHPEPYPFLLNGDLEDASAAVPENLRRSVAAQRRQFEGLYDYLVPVDLTVAEEGFHDPAYGGPRLKEALLEALPAAYRQTLVKLEHHILDYYGDPGNPVPRVFA